MAEEMPGLARKINRPDGSLGLDDKMNFHYRYRVIEIHLIFLRIQNDLLWK